MTSETTDPGSGPDPAPQGGYRSAKTRHFLSLERATGRFFFSAGVGVLAMLLTACGPATKTRAGAWCS